jgi:hypothetical protein
VVGFCALLWVLHNFLTSGIIEEYHLLGYNRRFRGTYRLQLCLPPAFTLVSCSAYSSTLNIEAICSSETSADFQRTARHYIPEDSTLHNHCCENPKSYKVEELSWEYPLLWNLVYWLGAPFSRAVAQVVSHMFITPDD